MRILIVSVMQHFIKISRNCTMYTIKGTTNNCLELLPECS